MTHTTVADVMAREVPAVHVSTPFKEIVRTLTAYDVGAIPVVDAGRHVIGVISAGDLLQRSAHPRPPIERRRRHHDRIHIPGEDGTARAYMSTPAVTARADEPVDGAARTALEHDVRQLPVVDADGRLEGMVSRVGLLRPFLRSDADIAADIVQQVVIEAFCLDPATVDVIVLDGVATLGGFLESPLMQEPFLAAVRGVEGVVSVRSKLNCGRGEERHAPPRRPMY